MDPNKCLHELVELAKRVQRMVDERDGASPPNMDILADALADRALALDAWICNGGALPRDWERR